MKRTIFGAGSRRVFRSTFAAVVLTVGVACATSGTDTGARDPAKVIASVPGYSQAEPLTLDQYCAERVAIQTPWCAYYSRCCPDNEQLLFSSIDACDSAIATQESCVSYYTSYIATTGSVYAGAYAQAALTDIKLVIPTAPTTCSGTHYADQVKLYDAVQGKRLDGPRALFQGQTANGAKCSYSTSCLFGSTCQDKGAGYVCTPRGTGSCATSNDCVSGKACVNLRCVTPLGDGDSCTARAECPFGSVCTTNGVCSSTLGKVGDPCKYGDACRQGLGCSLGTGTCIALKTAGATCSIDGECAGQCKSGKCADRCGGSGSY